mmetsp:Transcript_67829/g.107635  ORF Transcript_67829/g.107635 Transcript_67829/m.107635 type:complete len:268 (+) Transcript_67829:22-825(+)
MNQSLAVEFSQLYKCYMQQCFGCQKKYSKVFSIKNDDNHRSVLTAQHSTMIGAQHNLFYVTLQLIEIVHLHWSRSIRRHRAHLIRSANLSLSASSKYKQPMLSFAILHNARTMSSSSRYIHHLDTRIIIQLCNACRDHTILCISMTELSLSIQAKRVHFAVFGTANRMKLSGSDLGHILNVTNQHRRHVAAFIAAALTSLSLIACTARIYLAILAQKQSEVLARRHVDDFGGSQRRHLRRFGSGAFFAGASFAALPSAPCKHAAIVC